MCAMTPATIPQRYEPAVTLDRLHPHPANPNIGDQELIAELLAENGFAGAVLAQEKTGVLIDGEYRWRTATDEGMKTLPVIWCDIDDEARDRLLASFNESNRRGHNDQEKLLALLEPFTTTPKGMAGTAFTLDTIEDLRRLLTAPDLDDLPDNPDPAGSWPAVTIRAPHTVIAAWNDHAKTHGGNDAAAFAALLGLTFGFEDEDGARQ